jgi:hypothetical protein
MRPVMRDMSGNSRDADSLTLYCMKFGGSLRRSREIAQGFGGKRGKSKLSFFDHLRHSGFRESGKCADGAVDF